MDNEQGHAEAYKDVIHEDAIKVGGINQRLAGWANYFQLGSVSQAYRVVDQHTRYRLCKWLRWKHKVGRRGSTRLAAPYLYQILGLICLPRLTRFLPWARA
jgi:RNA-directed DNA polymerase